MCRSIQSFLFIAVLLLVPTETNAQINELEQLYGKGVHAWNAGLMQEALTVFDRAIEMGSRDPRVWYYRGVVQDSFGNAERALSDFNTGAELEAAASGRFYPVGRSLERVQGQVRLQIESARRHAKLVAREKGMDSAADGTGLVVRPVVPDGATGEIVPQPNFPDTSGGNYPNTPFADMPAALDSPPEQPAPVVDSPTPADDEPATVDDGDMPAEPETDPFGEDKPMDDDSGDDPFGDDDSAGDEPADDPFGDEEPMDDTEDDPFGEDSDPPQDDSGGDDSGDGDDPFGEDSDPPQDDSGDDDDPFGDG